MAVASLKAHGVWVRHTGTDMIGRIAFTDKTSEPPTLWIKYDPRDNTHLPKIRRPNSISAGAAHPSDLRKLPYEREPWFNFDSSFHQHPLNTDRVKEAPLV